MDRTYRPTLVALFIVTLVGFGFAFITGFSIGRFVVVFPLLPSAFTSCWPGGPTGPMTGGSRLSSRCARSLMRSRFSALRDGP